MHLSSVLSWPARTKIHHQRPPSQAKTAAEREGRRTWAREPCARVLDVDLPRRVVVPEEAPREDRDDVLLVVDVRHGDLLGLGVDVVGEGLVADAREAVPDETGRDGAGEVEGEEDGVEEGDRCTCYR